MLNAVQFEADEKQMARSLLERMILKHEAWRWWSCFERPKMETGSNAMNVDQERQQAHAYLDRLPPAQLSAVRNLLESMVEPVLSTLANAPPEDEEISEEEERAVAEAREWLKYNKPISHEEVLAEFGLTAADFERMGETPLPPAPRR